MTTQYNQEDFRPNEPLLLIYIGQTIGSDLSIKYPADVYAAVNGYWRMNPGELVDAPGYLVLARNSNRVLGAFRTKTWIRSPNEDRWGFVGEPAEMTAQLRYVGKRVPNQYRTQNPIRFVEPEE